MLAGREALLDSFDVVRRRVNELGEGDRPWIINGLRGVGKTVLLNELMSTVSGDGWIVAKVEVTASTPLPVTLAAALVKAMRTATGRHPASRLQRALGVFTSFSLAVNPAGAISLGVAVDPLRGVADSGRFAEDLAALFEVLGETSRELGIGTLILIDELQEASATELTAVNTAVHEVGQADVPLPVVVVGAGLPSLPTLLAEATSYAERLYDFQPVGVLLGDADGVALTAPARAQGVDWTPEALAGAREIADRYPYFLQLVGKHVWDAAVRSPISIDDVEVGGASALAEIDRGFYRARWERATPGQQQLMRRLAELGAGGAVAIADLVEPMGKKRVSDLSVARGELINKGLLYAPERGLLAFTVPGMHSFILREE